MDGRVEGATCSSALVNIRSYIQILQDHRSLYFLFLQLGVVVELHWTWTWSNENAAFFSRGPMGLPIRGHQEVARDSGGVRSCWRGVQYG